ncbi:MAG TPA: hypothetical protein VFZ97_10265 [Acidimicrobiales bacterium]
MATRLDTETETNRWPRVGVDRRSAEHLSIVQEECHPLSLCERWRLGFALVVASIVIDVAERLPRWDHFSRPGAQRYVP